MMVHAARHLIVRAIGVNTQVGPPMCFSGQFRLRHILIPLAQHAHMRARMERGCEDNQRGAAGESPIFR